MTLGSDRGGVDVPEGHGFLVMHAILVFGCMHAI